MPKSKTIQANQFYAILFVGRILTTLTYIPYISKGSISSDELLEIILTIVFWQLFLLPTYFLLKDSKDRNILDQASIISPVFKKVLAVLYSIAFIYAAISVITRFDVFLSMEMFLGYNYSLFILIVIAASAYAAWLGLEAIARSSVITTVIFVITLIVLIITVSDKISLLNLTPIMSEGFNKIFIPSVISTSRTVELFAIGILLPKVKGKIKAGFFVFETATCVCAEILFFLAVTVLGNFGNVKIFPLYTLSLLTEFGIFKGISTIVTGVWIFFVFLKTGFMIYLATECFGSVIKPSKKSRAIVIIMCAAIISALSLFASDSMERLEKISSPVIAVIIFFVLMFVAPITILIAEKIKFRKRAKE